MTAAGWVDFGTSKQSEMSPTPQKTSFWPHLSGGEDIDPGLARAVLQALALLHHNAWRKNAAEGILHCEVEVVRIPACKDFMCAA